MPQPLPEELVNITQLLLVRSPAAIERLPETLGAAIEAVPAFWAAFPDQALPLAQRMLGEMAEELVSAARETGHMPELSGDVWLRMSMLHGSIDADLMFRPFYGIPHDLPHLYDWVLMHPGCTIVGPSTVAASGGRRAHLVDTGDGGIRVSLSWQIACPIPQQDRDLLRAIGAIQTIERIEKEEVVLCLPQDD